MTRKITIDPMTRLEGHGRIDILLDDGGHLTDCRMIVPEIRGFEKFVEGRAVEELPRITPRICGVCPEAHHAASARAVDDSYGVSIPVTADIIRRLQYNSFVAGDHTTHFYALGGPDFIVGPDAPASERNIVGVIRKVGAQLGRDVIRMRGEAHEIAEMLGGRRVSPVGMIPGGVSKAVTPEMRDRLVQIGTFMVQFAMKTQEIFERMVLANGRYMDMIRSPAFAHSTYYAALVDEDDRVDHMGTHVRVVDPAGVEIARFAPSDYREHIAEHVEPWTYMKFPYLRKVGFSGLVDGRTSGVFRVGPLGMLNASRGMKTPLAQEQYAKMFEVLGPGPVHATLAFHWARIIEMLGCAELVLEYALDDRITGSIIRELPLGPAGEGFGAVEAPRGLLLHHYVASREGIVERANLIVGTTHNNAALNMSVRRAAESLIDGGAPDEAVLNTIEMAYRAYDPCFGCASHALPGRAALVVDIHGPDGALLRSISNTHCKGREGAR